MNEMVNLISQKKSQSKRNNGFYLMLLILAVISFLSLAGYRAYKQVVFSIECKGHLKRAADANVVPLALQELKTAISFLEANNMTEGYTSILIKTPDEDIGFWYQNLKASADELSKVDEQATQLEKSNLLMKLRETLLDQGQTSSVTVPAGAAVFPHNRWFLGLGILLGLILLVNIIMYMDRVHKGFTILDLMIVIAVIGIIISVAIRLGDFL
jgi:prepilin-type N-terminal cleavage/methylation domain-containing protein